MKYLINSLGETITVLDYSQHPPVYVTYPNFVEDKLICYVEYTGNFYQYSSSVGQYEVKIIDLIYGEIQAGNESYTNTDSTFWVYSGLDSCTDIFSFEQGDYDHALMVASYRDYNNKYYFSDCIQDLIRYPAPLEPSEYNNLVEEIESCMAHLCEDDLNLEGSHATTSIHKAASSITSTADVNANVVYKADDRVSLKSDFSTNNDYSFKVVMDGCD